MPEADGFELLELIQTGLNLSTPVVMMSTDDGDVRLKSLRSGAVQFLPKPVRPDELQALWQVGAASSAVGSVNTNAPFPGRRSRDDTPPQPMRSSTSLDALDAAGVAAGMGAGALLLQRRSMDLAGSAPGDTRSYPSAVSSSRVERLLHERELRRVRSLSGLTLEHLGLAAEEESWAPEAEAATLASSGRDLSSDNLAAMAEEPEVRQRLLVVANRLPVSAKKRPDGAWALEISAGGLVSALLGIQQNYDISWIGWPGVVVPPKEQPILTAALAKEGCIPVYLDEETIELYYNGYCNNVLWPLFHYVPLPFESKLDETNNVGVQFEAYRRANAAFAGAVLGQYCEGDVVWCHDYHLLLLPAMLRERSPRMKVGWFLHTPFPSSEIYRTLPLREELLHSVLKADLVGFHTYDYARHFVSACTRILGLEGTPEGVEDSGVSTRVAAFPIGIDPDRFTRALDTDAVKAHIAELRTRFAGRKIMLGVDRLDMIKGIPQKLLGFEKFLEEHPEWRDRVLLVQIAVPTRTNVREYKRLANQVRDGCSMWQPNRPESPSPAGARDCRPHQRSLRHTCLRAHSPPGPQPGVRRALRALRGHGRCPGHLPA